MMFMTFLQASFHLVFDRPFFLLHCMSVISIFLLCALRPFSSHTYAISVVSLLFFECLYYAGCSSSILVSELIFLCYSTHPSQRPHLIRLYHCLLYVCYCPVQHCWSDYWFIDLQLHWHFPVAEPTMLAATACHCVNADRTVCLSVGSLDCRDFPSQKATSLVVTTLHE